MRTSILLAAAAVLAAACPGAAPAQQAPREADTAKKCAICHYRWVYTFFVEHRGTPIADLVETKDVVGEPAMCLSCHDGSVRDSRDTICNTPSHKAGVVPSPGVTIPPNYTLDERGAMLCSTCHTPHAVAPRGRQMVSAFMREPNVDSSMCVKCHTAALGGFARGNHPIGAELYNPPEAIRAAGGRFGSEKGNRIICETCHMAHGGTTDNRLVLSVTDAHAQSILCETCHTKRPLKPGDDEYFRYSHPIDIRPDRRVRIPSRWANGDAIVRGTDGELVCRTCHRPHGAADARFLLAQQPGEDGLCVTCHPDQAVLIGSTHDLRRSAPQDMADNAATAGLGPCASCHSVHSGRANFMWSRAVHAGDCSRTYCSGCHGRGGPAEKKIPQRQSHTAGGPGSVSAGGLPLYSESCEPGARGSILCMSCHDVHNPAPRAGTATPRTGTYLRLADRGAGAVCASCHPAQGHVSNTPHDMRIAASGYRNSKGRTPARSGVCGACHVAHGAAIEPYMWGAPAGMGVPAAWTQDGQAGRNTMVSLCTGCHSPGGCGRKHQPRYGLHPGDFFAQATKNAGKIKNLHINLYTATGKATTTGGIVCQTCHNAHQWDPLRPAEGTGLKEGTVATSFLRPDLPQRFCAICHGAEALFRYLYFHNRPARGRKGEPFPFGDLQ